MDERGRGPIGARSLLRFGLAALGALMLAHTPAAAGAPQRPNLAGVWIPAQIVTASGKGAFDDPPMSAKGEATVKAWRDQYNLEGMEPNAHCVEPGMPTTMFGVGGQPLEIVQAEHRISIISEVGMQYRRIFMQGEKVPATWLPNRNGWSNGRWEGDTLVIDTVGIQEWLFNRWSHTDDTRTTERLYLRKSSELNIRRNQPLEGGQPLSDMILVNEITLFDPNIYDTPPKATIYYRQLKNDEFFEHNCAEGLWWDVMDKLRK